MKYLLLVFFASVIGSTIHGQVWNLVWEDNFNAGELDTTKWSYETGTGVNGDWGTGQLDRATDRVENVSFENGVPGADNGCLVITTQSEFYIDRNYTSGRINTKGKASWGPGHRIVSKVYPKDVRYQGQGFAFWMMPDELPNGWSYIMWPQGGEIDIMEYVGSIPFHNLGGVHYAWSWENNQWQSWNHGHLAAYYSYENQEVPNPTEPGYGGFPPLTNDPNAGSSGFHDYGIDWYEDRIEFFIDTTVYHVHYLNDGDAFSTDGQDQFEVSTIDGTRTGESEYSNHFSEWHPFEHKFYAILSAGVGGSSNTYGGAIVPEATFPCSVFIDWVKVYEMDTSLNVGSLNVNSSFNVYPNPTQQSLTVEIDKANKFKVLITDLSGNIVLSTTLNKSGTIDVSSLKKGVYVIWLNDGLSSLSKKITIN